MRNFFKVHSNWSYYSYLSKYNPHFIRKYQLGDNYFLGQRSLWRNLVYKFSGDHVSLEEEHNFKYKTHMVFTNATNRLAWFFFLYAGVYLSFYLGDVNRITQIIEWDHLVNPASNDDYPTRYERFYVVDKPQKY